MSARPVPIIPGGFGQVATKQQVIDLAVTTTLICNHCQVEMRLAYYRPDGYIYQCPTCQVREMTGIEYPAMRPATEYERSIWEAQQGEL